MRNHCFFHLLVLSMLLLSVDIQAQRSHGGQPLPESIERSASIAKCLSNRVIELPSFDIDSILREDSLYFNPHGPLPFAHKIPVNIHPDNAGITYIQDSLKVWKVAVRSEGAYSLNVVFDRFRIPQGGKLFLYNPDRSVVLGAFTQENMQESGEFPVAPVSGDELIIEYQEPLNAEFEGELQIFHINHDYRGMARISGKFQYLNMPCLPHLSCDTLYNTIGQSVCLLIMDGDTYCTGTFINNTRQDGTPYILTASHCLENDASLGSRTVVFLHYGSPRCMSDIQGSEEFSLSGCSTKALSNEVDVALLELNELPPNDYRPYYAGWNLDSMVMNQTPFTCIHHPYGEGKRYAVEETPLSTASWSGVNDGIQSNNHWRVKKWEIGHTWIGSSGAPLFNNKFQVIGSLTGGDSGGSRGCSSYTSGDYFARFMRAWDQFPDSNKQLKYWLDPDQTNQRSIEGFDPWRTLASKRLTNIAADDSIECIRLENASGYLFGHNQLNTSIFAEEFKSDSNLMLHGVYVMPAKGLKKQDYPVRIQVLEGNKTSIPGEILAEAIMSPYHTEYQSRSFQQVKKTAFANKENYIRFDSAIHVGNHFYVACQLSQPTQAAIEDSFALYASRKEINTAWIFDESWYPCSSYAHTPISAALWIEPVVHVQDRDNHSDDSIRSERAFNSYYSRSNRLLYIDFSENNEVPFDLKIYDVNGKCLYQKTTCSSPVHIPLIISGGVYLLGITHQNHYYPNKLIF